MGHDLIIASALIKERIYLWIQGLLIVTNTVTVSNS